MTDILCGVHAVKRVEGVYTGLFQFGQSYNFRHAVERGEVDMRDYPEVAQAARFQAAAMNIDYIVTKDLLGTDMARYNPEDIKEAVSPFTGEKYHAVKAARTDFTFCTSTLPMSTATCSGPSSATRTIWICSLPRPRVA